jgi:hypothetical protein
VQRKTGFLIQFLPNPELKSLRIPIMPDRHTDRERWEIYLLQILLATRPILFAVALILLLYAGAAMFAYPIISGVVFGLSLLLFAIVFSDQVSVYVARFGAWLATVGK